MEVVQGKRRLAIMFGNKRFKQISKEVTGISDKILAKELKLLEENLLVKRTVFDIFPPTVEYQITEHGESLEKVMIELKNWGELHRQKIIGK
ncbi:winged helix-turn-helix transcriptional regulator [Zhouia sp. PK063]